MYCPKCELEIKGEDQAECPICNSPLTDNPDEAAVPQSETSDDDLKLQELISDIDDKVHQNLEDSAAEELNIDDLSLSDTETADDDLSLDLTDQPEQSEPEESEFNLDFESDNQESETLSEEEPVFSLGDEEPSETSAGDETLATAGDTDESPEVIADLLPDSEDKEIDIAPDESAADTPLSLSEEEAEPQLTTDEAPAPAAPEPETIAEPESMQLEEDSAQPSIPETSVPEDELPSPGLEDETPAETEAAADEPEALDVTEPDLPSEPDALADISIDAEQEVNEIIDRLEDAGIDETPADDEPVMSSDDIPESLPEIIDPQDEVPDTAAMLSEDIAQEIDLPSEEESEKNSTKAILDKALDDLETTEDDSSRAAKKSYGKSVALIVILLIAVIGGGYFFINKSEILPKKEPVAKTAKKPKDEVLKKLLKKEPVQSQTLIKKEPVKTAKTATPPQPISKKPVQKAAVKKTPEVKKAAPPVQPKQPVQKIAKAKTAPVKKTAAPQPVKPPKKALVKKAPPAPSITYSVHAGSFRKKYVAEGEAKRFKSKGFKAFIAKTYLGNKGIWYRVKIGKYAKRDQAIKTQAKLKRVFKKVASRIVKNKP